MSKVEISQFDISQYLKDKDTIAEMLKDLGMKNVRANRIWRMSCDFINWDGKDATELFGIGKYGSDSYEIFYKDKIPDNLQDKELKRYVKEEIENVESYYGA